MINDQQIQAAKEAINRCREQDNTIRVRVDPENPMKTDRIQLKPGDKGYLPPATEFVTITFHNGSLTVEAEYFNKLPKYKKNKLMKY